MRKNKNKSKKKRFQKRKLKAIKEISAGGIIYKKINGHHLILLIKDSYGRWAIPKGKIKHKETPEQAARREIYEEVGLKNLEIKEKLGEIKYVYRLKNKLIFKLVHIFLIEALGYEKIHFQPHEIQGAKWFIPQEALNTIAYKNTKGLLEKAVGILTRQKRN